VGKVGREPDVSAAAPVPSLRSIGLRPGPDAFAKGKITPTWEARQWPEPR